MPFESIIVNDQIKKMVTKEESFKTIVSSLISVPVEELKQAAVILHTHMLSGGISSETMRKDYTKLVATLTAIEIKEVKGKVRKR